MFKLYVYSSNEATENRGKERIESQYRVCKSSSFLSSKNQRSRRCTVYKCSSNVIYEIFVQRALILTYVQAYAACEQNVQFQSRAHSYIHSDSTSGKEKCSTSGKEKWSTSGKEKCQLYTQWIEMRVYLCWISKIWTFCNGYEISTYFHVSVFI